MVQIAKLPLGGSGQYISLVASWSNSIAGISLAHNEAPRTRPYFDYTPSHVCRHQWTVVPLFMMKPSRSVPCEFCDDAHGAAAPDRLDWPGKLDRFKIVDGNDRSRTVLAEPGIGCGRAN